MRAVEIYDAIIRAFRWPVIANAILTAIALPAILVTGIIPPEALTEWTWLSADLSGALFILTVPDMRNQRAVMIFNAMAREDRAENGYGAHWSKTFGPDRLASLLVKIMFVEYAIMMFANMTLAIHLFAAIVGVGCLIMASMKYDPVIQEKLVADIPGSVAYTLPGACTMARLWLFAGLAGIGLSAAMAVACFAFGLTFYYHFGPHYGEAVSSPIMGAIIGSSALAFGLLAGRGWFILRNHSTAVHP